LEKTIEEKDRNVAIKTGELYASIWDQFHERQWETFSDNHFLNWSPLPAEDIDFIRGKLCLDAGCGSGRAVRSMFLSGADRVCAIDMGEGCVRNTKERNLPYAAKMEVQQASVLEIPYPDNTFDFVHCDGVLHHTTDPLRGFEELKRVLKPGGLMVVAVYGRGGLMNLAIYTSRLFRKIIPASFTFWLLKKLTSNPVTWYAIMDCMYVPIRENYYEYEVREWFEKGGFEDIVRMDSSWGPYGHGGWMKGEGYIKFKAKKSPL